MASSRKRYGDNREAHYKPTLAQIEAACLEIQSGWSVSEERARRGILAGTCDWYFIPYTTERLTRKLSHVGF